MAVIATFPSLDDAESALDWIGIDFVEREGRFDGELDPDDRDLLEAALDAEDTPAPVREPARALLGRWDADATPSLAYSVTWSG